MGEAKPAIEYLKKQLQIARELGDLMGESNALGNLGLAQSAVGNLETAIDLYNNSISIARAIDYRRSEESGMHNLGLAYSQLGQLDNAIEANALYFLLSL